MHMIHTGAPCVNEGQAKAQARQVKRMFKLRREREREKQIK